MIENVSIKKTSKLKNKVNTKDLIEKLYIKAKVKKALKDVEDNNLISTEQLEKEITTW